MQTEGKMQTKGKMQTESEMQTEDHRAGVKGRLSSLVEIFENFWFLQMTKIKRNLRLLLALNLFQFKEDSAIFPVNNNTSQQNQIS